MSDNVKIPRHIAVIMDGNGRWARQRGLHRLEGHKQGVESVRKVLTGCVRRGVGYLTIFVFSTENWGRPREEVDGLMELLCESVVAEMPSLVEQGVSVRVIGNLGSMSAKVKEHLGMIEQGTAGGNKLTMLMALNYGSREEITEAVRRLAVKVASGEMKAGDISPEMLSENLYTAGVPDPDLLIRTSGEYRLSNFLLWQSAYTEFYFTDVLWPDFGEDELDRAIEVYSKRDRRYGGIRADDDGGE